MQKGGETKKAQKQGGKKRKNEENNDKKKAKNEQIEGREKEAACRLEVGWRHHNCAILT